MSQSFTDNGKTTPQRLLSQQRSHVMFVLSEPEPGQDTSFLEWYQGAYRQAVSTMENVLKVQHYKQHEIDITRGEFPRIPFQYLGIYEISLDGAQLAGPLLERIASLHRDQVHARAPATWLYYPVSEKVGRAAEQSPSMLTLAFANAVAGKELEFREWYATRHIRHALNIPALVSGQCLERTQFQRPGALEARFHTIAMYEQEGGAEEILESFASLPDSLFEFPTLDTSRFAESVYRPI